MGAAETIALIRDVLFIVAPLVMIVALISILGMSLRLYSSIKRIARSLERISRIIYDIASRPWGLVGGVVKLLNRGLDMVRQIRKPESGKRVKMTKKNILLTGLMAGVVAGAVAGILLTPKPGRDMRAIVSHGAAGVTNRAGSYLHNARNRFRREPTGRAGLCTFRRRRPASL